MKKISKFRVEPNQNQILIPSDTILSVASENDGIYLYALINTEDTIDRPYDIKMYGTDHEIDDENDSFSFLGTVKTNEGLIFHVFCKGNLSMDQ